MPLITHETRKWYYVHLAPYLGLGAVAIVAVGLILGGVYLANSRAERLARELVAELHPQLVLDSLPSWESGKAFRLQQLRVADQLRLVRARLEHHSTLMADFYGYQYVAITVATICAVIAAGLLILITQAGWKDAPVLLRTFFFLAAAAAALFASFPALYRYEENILDNGTLYQGYQALRNEMHSYLATGERLSGKKQPLIQFIHYVDSGLVSLGKVAIGFDPSKIPEGGDLLKQIQ